MTKTKEMEEVTEVKGETPEQLMEEAAKMREEARAACGEEIDKILKKYDCNLSARMMIEQSGAYPQVFIIDARNS